MEENDPKKLTHDLRNHLAAIDAAVRVIAHGETSQQTLEILELIQDHIDSAVSSINKLSAVTQDNKKR